jgi:hypothetical protein
MAGSFTDARKRQLARLDGAKPRTARAAMALAKSQAYQDAADAPATLRAYTADLANFNPSYSRPRSVGVTGAALGRADFIANSEQALRRWVLSG